MSYDVKNNEKRMKNLDGKNQIFVKKTAVLKDFQIKQILGFVG